MRLDTYYVEVYAMMESNGISRRISLLKTLDNIMLSITNTGLLELQVNMGTSMATQAIWKINSQVSYERLCHIVDLILSNIMGDVKMFSKDNIAKIDGIIDYIPLRIKSYDNIELELLDKHRENLEY